MLDIRVQNCIPTGNVSSLVNINWNNDRYPQAPQLDANTSLIVFEADGPGMVTQIHATHYTPRNPMNLGSKAGAAILVRVWYDHEEKPAIDMPLMDFLGDCECGFGFYATKYFSKVKHSHNLYLLMPFHKHIKIVLENLTSIDLFGYTTIQYEKLETLPEQTGYLRTDYRKGRAVIPDEIIPLFESVHGGFITAHWLKISGDNALCKNGEYLCEANDVIFLDNEIEPAMEYLGTEDYYGYSWGFHGIQSDGYCAITQEDETTHGGATIGMLRCREHDTIQYTASCRIEMDYSQEYFSRNSRNPRHENVYPKLSFQIDYVSCYYYYSTLC